MNHELIKEKLKAFYEQFADVSTIVDFNSPAITVSSADVISESQRLALDEAVRSMFCWRQGPYNLFELKIDSEWRSDLKWDRLQPALGDLSGKVVADIGCSNGYFMFKLLGQGVEKVVGFDPFQNCNYQYQLLSYLIDNKRSNFLAKGVEDIVGFTASFDAILFMGVLYHRREPLETLKNLHAALKPGGFMILETMVLPDMVAEPIKIEGRYSKMNNVYCLTGMAGLARWVEDAGFSSYEVISVSATSSYEQRISEFSPFDSLREFLDEKDQSLTAEGLPAPRRMLIKCHA